MKAHAIYEEASAKGVLEAEIARLRASLKILWGILDQPPPEWKIIQDARNEVRRALNLTV